MRYRDQITFYETKTTAYSQEPVPDTSKATPTLGTVVASSSITASSYYDQMTGDAYLYIPADDPYVVASNHNLQGKFLEHGGIIYRIEESALGEHKLTTNKPVFVRCVLSATAHKLEED